MGLSQDVLESADGGVVINTRDGSGNSLTSTTISAKQALDVNIAGGSSSGTVPDETAFTYGTSDFQPVGGVFQDTSPSVTAGTTAAVRITANRAQHSNLRSAAGVELLGSATSANSIPVVVASDQGAIPVSQSGTWNVGLNAGTNLVGKFTVSQGGNDATVTASNELKVLDTNAGSILGLMKPSTAALTQPAGSTSSSTLLASNASRKGWSVVNATNKILYVAMGATATTSAFTVALQVNSFYESMDNRVYTGIISMISPSGVSGNAIVTEYT